MTLHFAYGSNMSRPLMRARCPGAGEIGLACLSGHRFTITPDGYASVVPAAGGVVYGVLWRLTPRDLAALNAYESLDRGLYVRRQLPVQHGGRRLRALVYVATREGAGRPRPGYQEIVLAAARDCDLPADYVRMLARFASGRTDGTADAVAPAPPAIATATPAIAMATPAIAMATPGGER